MGLVEIFGMIGLALKFSNEVFALLRLLRDTPEEKREKIMLTIQQEADKLAKTGRPTWS